MTNTVAWSIIPYQDRNSPADEAGLAVAARLTYFQTGAPLAVICVFHVVCTCLISAGGSGT